MPAATLAARLLYASRLAYTVLSDGTLAGSADSAAAGLSSTITSMASGQDDIDACLVARSADGLVISFRGTLPPDSPNHRQTAEDWLNDVEAALVSWPLLPAGGQAHGGFLASLDRLWPELRTAVAAQIGGASAPPIYVTGHSKGGALAHLAAFRLAREFELDPKALSACTFAAPHVGNAVFRDTYAQAVRSITRYEFADDLVPHVPLSLAMRHAFADVPLFQGLAIDWDYVAVGDLRFIDWDGHVVGDTPILRAERIAHLIRLICELGFDRLVFDHSLADGSGYFDGVVGPPPA